MAAAEKRAGDAERKVHGTAQELAHLREQANVRSKEMHGMKKAAGAAHTAHVEEVAALRAEIVAALSSAGDTVAAAAAAAARREALAAKDEEISALMAEVLVHLMTATHL